MQIKKLLFVPIIILLGIFLGYLSEKAQKEEMSLLYEENPTKTLQYKDFRTPTYLSEQLINIKTDYVKNRPEPKNRKEEIVAYYEDSIYNEFEKNPEVYETNGTVYINLDGHPKAIASNGEQYDSIMMPKLSASKNHIVYQLCDDKHNGCVVVVEEIKSKKKKILEDASSYSWHPHRELLIYDGSLEGDGHYILKSELFLYSPHENSIIELTDTKDFVETQPIFSKDGSEVYCADEKTGKLLHFNLFVVYRNSFVNGLKLYKTADTSLNLETIKQHTNKFKPIEKDEKFAEANMSYWIELEFSKEMEKGIYLTHTHPYIFDKNSFTTEQLTIQKNPKMFIPPVAPNENYYLEFNYDPTSDANRYYFHLASYAVTAPFAHGIIKIREVDIPKKEEIEQYRTYNYSQKNLKETILASMVIGMILMSALYTAVMFVRRRDANGERQTAFIYYTVMQITMALFLFTPHYYFRGLFTFDFLSMTYLSLIVALFATLFTQAFLGTKKHLPIMHMLLNIYLVLIVADMVWIFDPILLKYKLYEIFGLLFLVTAILRIKDGFKPAWFYLIGWIGLLVAIFLMDFFQMSNFLMYVGVFIESVMLAWGLVFHIEE